MKKNRIAESLIAVLQLIYIGDVIYIGQKEMNIIIRIIDILNHQIPMEITGYVAYWNMIYENYDEYELCPKCGTPLAYTYQACCGNCGQKLRWVAKSKMVWQKAL